MMVSRSVLIVVTPTATVIVCVICAALTSTNVAGVLVEQIECGQSECGVQGEHVSLSRLKGEVQFLPLAP